MAAFPKEAEDYYGLLDRMNAGTELTPLIGAEIEAELDRLEGWFRQEQASLEDMRNQIAEFLEGKVYRDARGRFTHFVIKPFVPPLTA